MLIAELGEFILQKIQYLKKNLVLKIELHPYWIKNYAFKHLSDSKQNIYLKLTSLEIQSY